MPKKQKAKLSSPKKPKVVKPKLSPEERFTKMQFNFVKSSLRKRSVWWPYRVKVKKSQYVDRRINKVSGRLAHHWCCALCQAIVPDSNFEMDHIVPIGKERPHWDWIARLLAPESNWQGLCKPCHAAKTLIDNKETRSE